MSKLLLLFALLTLSGCNSLNDELPGIEPAKGFPKWLKTGEIFTQQTSGITFIGTKPENVKHFLLSDDVGKLHRLSIEQDTVLTLTVISFGKEVESFLNTLPKKDIEEITLDKFTGEVYITIEGNVPKLDAAGVYKLKFYNNDLFSDSVISIEKLKITPESEFLRYTADNIGFEGLAIDDKYFYIGLEGFSSEGIFADSTLLYIISKETLQIRKIINTRSLGIYTICGLYSDGERNLYGIDRNNKKIFKILVDDELKIVKFKVTDLISNIPDYPNLQYTASLEGLTMDNEKNLYLVDDPWEDYFVPSKNILNQLDEQTIINFRNYIPVIFKYKIK